MAFTSNIRAFRNLAQPDALINSYCLLVAVELALKDGNCVVPGSINHDVPGMLQVAANLPTALPFVSAQLLSFSQSLRNNLGLITCQGKSGAPQPVPPANYPFIRYGRYMGDWGGMSETPNQYFANLGTR